MGYVTIIRPINCAITFVSVLVGAWITTGFIYTPQLILAGMIGFIVCAFGNIVNDLYDIEIENMKGEIKTLKEYAGKVLIIVNTASKCGFTPQYNDLQTLYEQYNSEGLEILAFPCNQFGEQEKGSNDDIQSFCQINFGLTFPVMGKLNVNGDEESPLYTYLKSEKKGLLGKNIKWNFTKFLVDRNGNVVKRFAPTLTPLKMNKDIIKYLQE